MPRLCVIALLLPLLLGRPARAGDSPDDEAAQRHFNRGRELYNEAKYADAIAEFTAARELHASPAFDYNIARCYDRLERWGDAAEAYERYLRSGPPESERQELVARITLLRERARRAAAAPPRLTTTATSPATTLATPPPRRRPWVWGLVGGSAVIVVGVALGVGLGLGLPRHHATRIMDVQF